MKKIFLAFLVLTSLAIRANNKTNQIVNDTITVIDKNVTYSLYDDNYYVYLNINTSDKSTSMSLLRNGLTVYFDVKGKENKNVYIKYPYEAGPRQPRQRPEKNSSANNSKTINFNTFIENIPSEAEYGYYDNILQFHKDLNSEDISLNYTANKESLEFSLKIPKVKINSDVKTNFSKLTVGIVTNKRERKSNYDRETTRGQRGDGNHGGGKNRGGQHSGNRGGNGKNNSLQKEQTSIDFWFDASIKRD